MKKILPFFLMILYAAALEAQTVSVSPSDPDIQYMGRINFADPNAPDFSQPGVSITASFNGTGISANFSSSGTSYVYVIVDGNDDPYQRQVTAIGGNNNSVVLASGLSSGNHTVKVVKTNEYDTKLIFNGFTVTGNGLNSPPARPSRQIEYYGDSNPSGWGAWDVRDEGVNELSGGYHTYPGMVARMLNAEYSNMSAGGWGTTSKTRRMNINDVYDRIHIEARASSTNSWDFANNYWNFHPDVVVINLGANDYYNGASEQQIRDGWNQLITSVRQGNPNAHVVMVNSYGWAFNEPADYVGDFVQTRQQNGDNNISFVRLPWLWSDYHAVVNEHAGFANIIADHIANEMGWATPSHLSYSSFGQNDNVGNGSFESSLIDGFADGWRPFATWSNPEYVTDGGAAYDGNSFIRCPDTFGVMHANSAAPGDVFDLSVFAKALSGNTGRLKYEFRDQGQGVIVANQTDVSLNSNWQEITLTTSAAPAGTWQINVILEAVNGSTIDFDLASMSKSTGGTVSVTGVTVNPSSANLLVNETIQLSETVSPANATDKSVNWSTGNASVATVNSNGLVTAQGDGTTTITATTNDGSFTANCSVTVTSGGTGGTMHVVSIVEGSQAAGGPNSNGTATILIEDAGGNPVANASVTASFTGDFNESVTGTTDANGIALLVTWGKKKGAVNIDVCVDNVTHSTNSYDANSNVITCTGGSGSRTLNNGPIRNDLISNEFQIYPNPISKGELKILFDNVVMQAQIQIIDIQGKVQKQTLLLNQQSTQLDVSELWKGLYLVKIKGSEIDLTQRVIIN